MSKLNPLHTPEMIMRMIAATGDYFDPKWGSGRSTALALHYISNAIEHPLTPIRIKDHRDSCEADRKLAKIVKMMILKLELKHMYVWVEYENALKFYVSFGAPPNR